jgi:hypothetical protein
MTKNCRSSPKGGERYLNVTRRLAAAIGFVGEFMSGDTPDPIPNSEVKPRQPMILLSGKVGHCRLFQPPVLTDWGLSFYIDKVDVIPGRNSGLEQNNPQNLRVSCKVL